MSYNANIPQPPDKLSVSQGQLLINFQQANAIFANNHFAFDSGANAGKHKYVQLTEGAINGACPINVPVGDDLLYSSVISQGELFYARGGTALNAIGIRLTGPGNPLANANGYTFLPGGMLIQWGSSTAVLNSASTPIVFPIAFNTVFSVTTTVVTSDNSTIRFSILGNATTTGFTTTQTNSNKFTNLYWTAIGK